MRSIDSLLLLGTLSTTLLAANAPRPRGVGPECKSHPIPPPSSSTSIEPPPPKLTPLSLSSQMRNSTNPLRRSPAFQTPPSPCIPPKSMTISATAQTAPTSPAPPRAPTSPPSPPFSRSAARRTGHPTRVLRSLGFTARTKGMCRSMRRSMW